MIDPLTLDQLRILVAVVEAGSFSAAARKLGRVQSAVSQAIQALETTLGVTLFDRSTKTPGLTEAGAALVADARAIIEQARVFRARAQSMAEGVEAELTLSVDVTFPMPLLMQSLGALRHAFPKLPVTVFNDALGGAEETLRSGAARMAILPLQDANLNDLETEFLMSIALEPVVAAEHPLAREPSPLPRSAFQTHVQLVLTGRTLYAQNVRGGILSPHIWRFADLTTRLDFLLAGFGWCNMPRHMIEPHVEAGRLVRLQIVDQQPPEFRVYVAIEKGRRLGRAGKWLIEDLRNRLTTFPRPLAAPQNSAFT